MHTKDARTVNLLGAVGLEVAAAAERGTRNAVGAGGATAAALVTIDAYPGRTIEELRAPLRLSQPGAVRLVERLAEAGWVTRAGPRGRRGLELRLTAAGEDVLKELLRERRVAVQELLEPLSAREREQLTGLLEKLLAGRTRTRADLERLCRLCERAACTRCPVSRALA
jgi:MarR family transcriptional regulator, negative regulator of the multidrug operon emrRAB